MRRRLSELLDYQWPILGGIASWAHCLLGDERFVRWLRTNDTYEPEIVA